MSAYIAKDDEEAKRLYLQDLAESPEDVDWVDEGTGLSCRLRRQSMGHWCGYVQVRQMNEEEMERVGEIRIHGGVTYCDGQLVGWDAAHQGDYVPRLLFGRRIWTMEAAKNETSRLAAALKRML